MTIRAVLQAVGEAFRQLYNEPAGC